MDKIAAWLTAVYPQSRIHSSFDKFMVLRPNLAFIMSLWICSNFIKMMLQQALSPETEGSYHCGLNSAKISFQEAALHRQSSWKTIISFCLIFFSLPLPLTDIINRIWSTPGWKGWASRWGQSGTKEGFAEGRSQKKKEPTIQTGGTTLENGWEKRIG